MKSKQLTSLLGSIQAHILDALRDLYTQSGSGNEPLKLGKNAITYSGWTDYEVQYIHIDYTEYTTGELRFYQSELDEDGKEIGEYENYPVTSLGLEKMVELLGAVEIVVGKHYQPGFRYGQKLKNKPKQKVRILLPNGGLVYHEVGLDKVTNIITDTGLLKVIIYKEDNGKIEYTGCEFETYN